MYTNQMELKAFDVRLNVKPVFSTLIHRNSNEGPCRWGSKEHLDPEMDEVKGKKGFDGFCNEVTNNLTSEAKVLEPAHITFKDDWVIKEQEFEKLESTSEEVDLYLIGGAHHLHFPCANIGERYEKAVAVIGDTYCSADLRARNLEGYGLLNYEELNHLITLLRIRKALRKTKILRILDREISPGIINTAWGLDCIKTKFGMDYKNIPIKELAEEIDRFGLEKKRAEERTDELIRNAEEVHMKREYIIDSVNFYLGVKSLMQKYECNAFTTDCYEICPDGRVSAERKAVPCLTHSLLKDEGIPSACEGDISALLTIAVLMYVSGKSTYMGNLNLSKGEGKNPVVRFGHNVPGIKMKGFDKQDSPYIIRNFTYEGWGATLHYDFSQDKGEEVTLARFSPLADKVLVAKGKIAGCDGFDEVGCRLVALIEVSDSVELFHKMSDFGRHFTMVYGDYRKELQELGELMNFGSSDLSVVE